MHLDLNQARDLSFYDPYGSVTNRVNAASPQDLLGQGGLRAHGGFCDPERLGFASNIFMESIGVQKRKPRPSALSTMTESHPVSGSAHGMSLSSGPDLMSPYASHLCRERYNPLLVSDPSRGSNVAESNSFATLAHDGLPTHMVPHPPALDYYSATPTEPSATPTTVADSDAGTSPTDDMHCNLRSESVHESDVADPCYAQLLWKCLMETPGHELSLRQLYAWISHNSPKAKDPNNKGWMNSVRHNLSMNAGFEKVPLAVGSKKGSLWRLSDEAISKGIVSTTRFRKDPKRKSQRSLIPAPKRVISGAKGGQASRRAAHHRRQRPHVSAGSNNGVSGARTAWSSPEQRRQTQAITATGPLSTNEYPIIQAPHSPYFVDATNMSRMAYNFAVTSAPRTLQSNASVPRTWDSGQHLSADFQNPHGHMGYGLSMNPGDATGDSFGRTCGDIMDMFDGFWHHQ